MLGTLAPEPALARPDLLAVPVAAALKALDPADAARVGVAEIDASFSPDQQRLLETALSEGGVDFEVEIYKGAKHGFAVTNHLVYDRDASERHWQRLVRLFAETLKTP